MQTDPIGYKDQMNLYGYVGNDPINLSDPSGLCGARYENGRCKVEVRPDASEDEKTAARALEDRLNAADAKINSLEDEAVLEVTDQDGKVVGTITGSEAKTIWNKTVWAITSGKDFKNGGAGGAAGGSWNDKGEFEADRVELNETTVSTYMKVGYGPVAGVDTLIFHELGHLTKGGYAMTKQYPPDIYAPSSPEGAIREGRASSYGKRLADQGGASYVCAMTGGCK